MKKSFLNFARPPLTVMLQCPDPEIAIQRIQKSIPLGADAFGLQVESLPSELQRKDVLERIFGEMQDKPSYVTYYRKKGNLEKSDEELADGLLRLAGWGATLCDVIGDLYSPHPEELTEDPQAIRKQMHLIEKIHEAGAEVLMSSHVHQFRDAKRVIEIALEQERRGADIVKIVTRAENMEQQIENLRITHLLKENLQIPFLFLSGGVCQIHRRIGGNLGCCMYLCVYKHDSFSTASQPLLEKMKRIRDNMEW